MARGSAAGCDASPSVTAISRSRAPAAASMAIVPPTPRTSSSGWAATITALGQPSGSAAGRCFSPAQSSQASSAVPGRSIRFGATRRGATTWCRDGHERAELGQVALGVMLPQVHGEIRDPAGMRLVVAQRARPERAAHPVHDLGGHGLDQRTEPEGPQSAAALPVGRVRVDLGRRRVERRPRRMQGDVDRAEVGQGVRPYVTFGRGGQQRPPDAAGPAVPACGHPGTAVREARPVGVAARVRRPAGPRCW